jgi:sterol desaturase/sphingolipid hydroxylase (fatty acid hydroxylase superfamily)
VQIRLKNAGVGGTAAAVVLLLLAVIWLGVSQAPISGSSLVPDALGLIHLSISSRVNGLFSERTLKLLLLVGVVLALEIAAVGWANSSLFRLAFRRRRSAIVDALFLLTVLLGLGGILEIVLTFGVSIGTTRFVNWVLAQYGWSRIDLPSDGLWQLAVGFSIYWLATTFFDYWGHRLMHVRWCWHLHRFHHAATELNVITVFRQHPVEPLVLGFLRIVSPLIFFDVPDQILLIYFVWGTTFDLLAHSQLPWEYGWFGRWIVASPKVHQVHHSIDDEHRDMHFSKCPLWDHMFGTWYKGTKTPVEYGIPDNQYEVRPVRQFAYDALTFYATVVRGLSGGLTPWSRGAD